MTLNPSETIRIYQKLECFLLYEVICRPLLALSPSLDLGVPAQAFRRTI